MEGLQALLFRLVLLFAFHRHICTGQSCPDIDVVQYADITSTSSPPYRVGAVVNFTCDVGFKGVGKGSITCLKSGRWSGPVPYCTAYVCTRDKNRVEKGRKCRKKCKSHSNCKGGFKKCECDDWCGLSCFNPNADCPQLSAPVNGYIVGNEISYGYTVTYGCNDGFVLTGPATRKCRSDKKWSGYPPKCVPYSTCGQPGNEEEERFKGKVHEGTNAKKGAWPWQALLIHNFDYSADQIYNVKAGFGGGSVIDGNWILSAAHVVDKFPTAKTKKNWKDHFHVIVGMTAYPKKGHVIPDHVHIFEPESVYIHPDFNKDNFDYDVALIRIGKRLKRGGNGKFVVDSKATHGTFEFSRFIRPVCLPCMKGDPLVSVDIWKNFDREKCNPRGRSILSALITVGSYVMVTGFGLKTDPGDDFKYSPQNLQEGLLKVVDELKCAASIKDIQRFVSQARFTNRMLCASGVNDTSKIDSCQGDSGGPLVKQFSATTYTKYWMQIGIVSWGWECGNKHPGYYTSVTSIMSWVWKILDDTRIGTWKEWEAWGECTKTCYRGVQRRKRTCATKNCRGASSDTQYCNTNPCPPAIQCPTVRAPSYGSMHKNTRSSFFGVNTVVTFSCNAGKYLKSGPRTITCGANGQWSDKRKPICSDEWGPWTSWSACSATCGGARTKTRKCLRKTNIMSGEIGCAGNYMIYQKCKNPACPAETPCGGSGNLCIGGNINVDGRTAVQQATRLFSNFFGRRKR